MGENTITNTYLCVWVVAKINVFELYSSLLNPHPHLELLRSKFFFTKTWHLAFDFLKLHFFRILEHACSVRQHQTKDIKKGPTRVSSNWFVFVDKMVVEFEAIGANICSKLVPMHSITVNNRSTYWRTLIPFIHCIDYWGDINRTVPTTLCMYSSYSGIEC